MEATNSGVHQKKRDVWPSIKNDCVEMAANSHRKHKSQAPSKQNTMVPVNLTYVVSKQVLSSLPVLLHKGTLLISLALFPSDFDIAIRMEQMINIGFHYWNGDDYGFSMNHETDFSNVAFR